MVWPNCGWKSLFGMVNDWNQMTLWILFIYTFYNYSFDRPNGWFWFHKYAYISTMGCSLNSEWIHHKKLTKLRKGKRLKLNLYSLRKKQINRVSHIFLYKYLHFFRVKFYKMEFTLKKNSHRKKTYKWALKHGHFFSFKRMFCYLFAIIS